MVDAIAEKINKLITAFAVTLIYFSTKKSTLL